MEPSEDEPPTNALIEHEARRIAQPTASSTQILFEGPPYKLCWEWFLDLPGAEYVGLYLWLIKDACWSQIRWSKGFGILAMLWLGGMTVSALRSTLYSEAYLACGLFLWLLANFCWMISEFTSLRWIPGEERYEEIGHALAKYLLLLSVVALVIFFSILVPLDVFASDRKSELLCRFEATSPPCPKIVIKWLKEFRIYASLHLLAWAIKDCLWAWNLAIPYLIAFICTILLNIDLIYRFSRYTLQYINLIHAILVLLWVLANGVWALGELSAEVGLSEDEFRKYQFVLQRSNISNPAFEPRWLAGYVFIFAVLVLVAFYIQWIVVTIKGRVSSYDDFQVECSKEITEDEGSCKLQANGVAA